MNLNDFLDAKFEVIGFHKDAVVLLDKERQQCAIVKFTVIQRLLGKLVTQYNDPEAVRDLTDNLENL